MLDSGRDARAELATKCCNRRKLPGELGGGVERGDVVAHRADGEASVTDVLPKPFDVRNGGGFEPFQDGRGDFASPLRPGAVIGPFGGLVEQCEREVNVFAMQLQRHRL